MTQEELLKLAQRLVTKSNLKKQEKKSYNKKQSAKYTLVGIDNDERLDFSRTNEIAVYLGVALITIQRAVEKYKHNEEGILKSKKTKNKYKIIVNYIRMN